MQIYTLIGLIAVLFVLMQLVRGVSKSLPLLDLMFFIAGIQWILGPYIDYTTLAKHYKYFMYTSEDTYMSVIVPLYLAFILPYYLFKKNYPFNFKIKDLNHIGFLLIILGFSVILIGKFIPNSLAFVFYLLENLLYVGAGIILLQENSRYKKWAYSVIAWLTYTAISSGFFHTLILWSLFLFFIIAIRLKIRWYFTIFVFLIGFISLSLIQSIKHDFRSKLAKTNNPIELFTELVITSYSQGFVKDEKQVNEINVRLNQGWIISAIIQNVPKKEPYANGSTITEALWTSLLPRFLNPNKKEAGGSSFVKRFTGLNISKGTSMGISIIGEAYVNYGKNGGIIFMFIWGLFLTLFWNFLLKKSQKNNLLIFFIPLIFLQVMKAETELSVVLNHLVKSSIISFLLLWLLPYRHKLMDT